MKKVLVPLVASACAILWVIAACAEPDQIDLFTTYTVKKGDTLWKIAHNHWKTAAKINRISPDRLKIGKKLIIPHNWEIAEHNAPVPQELPGLEGKLILVNITAQAFGAYENGALVLWGPISSASSRIECGRQNEKKRECVTPTGDFRIIEKKEKDFSKDYPLPYGGAPMPYSQKFYGAYKIHEGTLPGYPDSHGCVHVLREDAQWLFRWTNKKTRIIVIKDPRVHAGLFYENQKKTGMARLPSPWFGSPHCSGLSLVTSSAVYTLRHLLYGFVFSLYHPCQERFLKKIKSRITVWQVV